MHKNKTEHIPSSHRLLRPVIEHCKEHPSSFLTRTAIRHPKVFRHVIPELFQTAYANQQRHVSEASKTCCACSVCDDDYIPGLIIFMESLLRHNPWFNLPYVIFSDSDKELQPKHKDLLLKIYPHFIFSNLDETYSPIKRKNKNNLRHARFTQTYLGLSAFNLSEFDRVLYLDTDLLCLGNIQTILEETKSADFVGVYDRQRDHTARKYFETQNQNRSFKTVSSEDFDHNINTGIYVINKRLLTDRVFKDLFDYAEHGIRSTNDPEGDPEVIHRHLSKQKSLGDQEVINYYLSQQKGLKIAYAPLCYNTSTRLCKSRISSRKILQEKPLILHFLGDKPWFKELNTRGPWWWIRKLWIKHAYTYLTLVRNGQLS